MHFRPESAITHLNICGRSTCTITKFQNIHFGNWPNNKKEWRNAKGQRNNCVAWKNLKLVELTWPIHFLRLSCVKVFFLLFLKLQTCCRLSSLQVCA